MKLRVLFVDDQAELFEGGRFDKVLRQNEIEIEYESLSLKTFERLREGRFDLLLLDLVFEGQELQGEDVLKRVNEEFPAMPVVILTSVDKASHAYHLTNALGAFDYIPKSEEGIDLDRLAVAIRRGVEHARLQEKYLFLKRLHDQASGGELLGTSLPMKEVRKRIAQAAAADRTAVLILGETGTGKELAAAALHSQSARRKEAFLTINCAAIPRDLLETQLFGHEKGAFTGAHQPHKGFFELADGGSIFLDEIAEMGADLQSKLLRVLQDGEFFPVGAEQLRKVDVRVISATNRDLREEVRQTRFREDLYYRLNVLTIEMPPLRERSEDIPELAAGLMPKLAAEVGRRFKGISRDALELLRAYPWPGNVRELENMLHRAMVLADPDQDTLEVDDFAELKTSQSSFPFYDVADLKILAQALYSGELKLENCLSHTRVSILQELLLNLMALMAEQRKRIPTQEELANVLNVSRTSLANLLSRSKLSYRRLKATAESRMTEKKAERRSGIGGGRL